VNGRILNNENGKNVCKAVINKEKSKIEMIVGGGMARWKNRDSDWEWKI
jgi:hypothetical protein